MSAQRINEFCGNLFAATCVNSFGPEHDVWKIGGKVFAIVSRPRGSVSFKCNDIEAAQLLIESGAAHKAPYCHASWAMVVYGEMPDDELNARLSASYTIMRKSLPKKVQAELE
ncbi:MAG: MmcQ/YjbR family DNA-binding protein [Notoacmeibacter sp.]